MGESTALQTLIYPVEAKCGNNLPNRYKGTHDFRNLCKMDVGNGVLQFERTILSASVRPVNPEHTSSTDQYDVFVFEVKGLAFLYHQVSENLTECI